MNKQLQVLTLITALGLSGAAHAALIDRGGGLIYDQDLNITWLQDANYAMTSGYHATGNMTWSEATTWAANLSYDDSVRGVTYTDWRLPSTTDTGTPGCNFAYSGTDCGVNVDTATGEMAHLFYDELGNKGPYNVFGYYGYWHPDGSGLVNTGPFSNLQQDIFYWSGTGYAQNANQAWCFDFYMGDQSVCSTGGHLRALAVRSGDVAAVPLPAAAWLFGSGLLGLIGVARRKRCLRNA